MDIAGRDKRAPSQLLHRGCGAPDQFRAAAGGDYIRSCLSEYLAESQADAARSANYDSSPFFEFK